MFNEDYSELHFINSIDEETWGESITDMDDESPRFLDCVLPADRPTVGKSMQNLTVGGSVEIE